MRGRGGGSSLDKSRRWRWHPPECGTPMSCLRSQKSSRGGVLGRLDLSTSTSALHLCDSSTSLGPPNRTRSLGTFSCIGAKVRGQGQQEGLDLGWFLPRRREDGGGMGSPPNSLVPV